MYKNDDRVLLLRSLVSVRFLLTAVVLVLAAISLRPGMKALSQRYTKKAISICRPLKEFDISSLPSFRNGWDFVCEPLPISEKTLGTDEYLIMKLNRIGQKNDSATVFITYYSDPKDKVPHTPEMCFTQGGAVIKETSVVTLETAELGKEYSQTQGRLLIFDIPKSNSDEVVLYCFCAEGEFRLSRNQTRLVLSKPGNRYTYFCKIEIRSVCPSDKDHTESTERCKTLFREVLAVLLKEYLPGKEQLAGS